VIDHGIRHPHYRLHVVPAVLSLASVSWQREVWLDSAQPENLDQVIHVLFDDFCDADDPQRWLGASLRTQEEVELMAQLGEAYGAVQDAIGPTAPDTAYLDDQDWPRVLAVAARLAQVMVRNDLRAAVDATEINSASNMASGDPRDRT
jgi:hypothetical protein